MDPLLMPRLDGRMTREDMLRILGESPAAPAGPVPAPTREQQLLAYQNRMGNTIGGANQSAPSAAPMVGAAGVPAEPAPQPRAAIQELAAMAPLPPPTQQLGLAPAAPTAAPPADPKFFPGTTVNRDDPYAFGKVGVDPRDAKAYIGWGGPMPTLGFAPPAGTQPTDPMAVYQNAYNMAMRNSVVNDPAEAARLATAGAGQVLNATMDMERYNRQFSDAGQKRQLLSKVAESAAAKVLSDGGTPAEAAAAANALLEAQKSQAAGDSAPPAADIGQARNAARLSLSKPGGAPGAAPAFDINPASVKSFGERLIGMSPDQINALAADINAGKLGDRAAIRDELARQLYYDASLADKSGPSGRSYTPADISGVEGAAVYNTPSSLLGGLGRAAGNAINPIGLLRLGGGTGLNQLRLQDGTVLDLGIGGTASYADRLNADRNRLMPSIQARNALLQRIFSQGK